MFIVFYFGILEIYLNVELINDYFEIMRKIFCCPIFLQMRLKKIHILECNITEAKIVIQIPLDFFMHIDAIFVLYKKRMAGMTHITLHSF